jgi:hypothetical protein
MAAASEDDASWMDAAFEDANFWYSQSTNVSDASLSRNSRILIENLEENADEDWDNIATFAPHILNNIIINKKCWDIVPGNKKGKLLRSYLEQPALHNKGNRYEGDPSAFKSGMSHSHNERDCGNVWSVRFILLSDFVPDEPGGAASASAINARTVGELRDCIEGSSRLHEYAFSFLCTTDVSRPENSRLLSVLTAVFFQMHLNLDKVKHSTIELFRDCYLLHELFEAFESRSRNSLHFRLKILHLKENMRIMVTRPVEHDIDYRTMITICEHKLIMSNITCLSGYKGRNAAVCEGIVKYNDFSRLSSVPLLGLPDVLELTGVDGEDLPSVRKFGRVSISTSLWPLLDDGNIYYRPYEANVENF